MIIVRNAHVVMRVRIKTSIYFKLISRTSEQGPQFLQALASTLQVSNTSCVMQASFAHVAYTHYVAKACAFYLCVAVTSMCFSAQSCDGRDSASCPRSCVPAATSAAAVDEGSCFTCSGFTWLYHEEAPNHGPML